MSSLDNSSLILVNSSLYRQDVVGILKETGGFILKFWDVVSVKSVLSRDRKDPCGYDSRIVDLCMVS